MRFFRRGRSKIYIVPTVAGVSPTATELTAGTDISGSIAGIAGFGITNNPISVPDLGTAFASQIDGEDSVKDSSLTFYDDDLDLTLRASLVKGTTLCLVLMPYGKVTGKRCEVWRCKSTGYNDQWSLGSDAAQAEAGFAVLSPPNQAGTLP